MVLSKRSLSKNAAAIVDWNAFLREPDPEPDDENKPSTRHRVTTMGNNFKKCRPSLASIGQIHG
ncbi:uncharacterized protein N7469_004334 [Penicillium citrinum]|uniref:Uncharacterized protein n=2 Tax=Penicillium TaxID=5073 RepID=A0A9W9P4K7_PENCI|nr:uncharacterized protein N7469_004334 [Penicillium citrinum]KAJ5235166.1 hypothetical protein N7469_004334 [Penicillium citrinum]KAJ5590791.1 hypothetical protein N7450_004763 [Penicillium hetheringtonii]KAK5800391.1 hypothetical protein VI817_002603 [Penicillium citrinum]